MLSIAHWLNTIGLGQYAQRFAENCIDADVLRDLTDRDLEKIGLPLGHRKKLLRAIRELADASLATPPPATASQPGPHDSAGRRQLTVMFCDLVGSTALSTRLDPEDLQAIISAYHRYCAEVIAKSGGFVARYLGDGVLAYFGYPQAHEDNAERAVRAGLALVEGLAKLNDVQATPLHLRVGIATGLVLVGDPIGGDEAHENEVVGATLNLAARLQAFAEPDTVVVDHTSHLLIGGLFEYRALGSVIFKGFPNPVLVWQVIGTSILDSRFEALHATRTPLVGREEEIELLLRRWRQAANRDGRVVLLSGEPGIGKSRLTVELQERLQAESRTCLHHFCSPHHQDSPLHPIISQLQRAAGFRRDDTDEEQLDKLTAMLARATDDLTEAAPLIANLLSVPTGDRYPRVDLTPQKRKEKTLRALLAQLEGMAAREPVLVVFEDVHWIDPTSLELLDLIVDRVPALPMLLIITFRPEFSPRWVGRPHVTLLALNRLSPTQRAEMIAGVSGGKALPPEITDQIIDRTDGVPLFIEELTKTVVESDVLVEAGDRYAATGPAVPLAIPMTLQASLLARLDRLPATREVAQIGAALGRSFSHELISAVAQMPQQQVDDALAQLVGAELAFRRGSPPDAEYAFKHALVQDVAYDTLLGSQRKEIHGRIAATLESQFPEVMAAQPEVLAQHCSKANLKEKAVGYWLKAGQQALARSAMAEAVVRLQKGLELLSSLPEGRQRQHQELELRVALGQAQVATKGFAAREVGEAFARSRVLVEQLDRPDDLLAVLNGQWAFHLMRAELRLALSLAEQTEQIGEARNDPTVLFLGPYQRGVTHFYLGEFVTARTLFERCQGRCGPALRAFMGAPSAVIPGSLAQTLAYLGCVDQARAHANQALTEARRLHHAHGVAQVLIQACLVEWLTGSPHDVRRYAEEAVALSSEHGFPLFLDWGMILLGWSLSALGEAKDGVALLTKGLSAYRAMGGVLRAPWALILLAEAHRNLGRPSESLNCLIEAAQIIETTDQRYVQPELHRLRGDLLEATGDRVGAQQNYRLALTIAARQSAKISEVRAATSLTRLWLGQGKREDARDLLAPIYNWFTEGSDTPVLKEARAVLEQIDRLSPATRR